MSGATVWIASYPKSGNTWLRAVLTACRTGGPIDLDHLDGTPVAASRRVFDGMLGVASSSMSADEVERLRPRADELLSSGSDRLRLRKIHDGYFHGAGGEPIVSARATRGAIYVVRDPRDVAVSYSHHQGESLAWACDRLADRDAAMNAHEDRLPEQLRQRVGSWSDHVRSWLDEPPFPVELVRYEDCVAEPLATFTRVVRFAGLDDVDEERVATAVEQAAFERLHRAERDGGFRERPPEADVFFRRGRAGGWRDELPPPLAARVAADHRDVMERLGYA